MTTSSSSSSGRAGNVSPHTLARVRDALRLHLEDRCPNGELGDALRALSTEARSQAVLPENVILSLRQIFRELEGASSFTPPDDRRAKLERVITTAIEEYFSTQ